MKKLTILIAMLMATSAWAEMVYLRCNSEGIDLKYYDNNSINIWIKLYMHSEKIEFSDFNDPENFNRTGYQDFQPRIIEWVDDSRVYKIDRRSLELSITERYLSRVNERGTYMCEKTEDLGYFDILRYAFPTIENKI